jgi:hypothetical protein
MLDGHREKAAPPILQERDADFVVDTPPFEAG